MVRIPMQCSEQIFSELCIPHANRDSGEDSADHLHIFWKCPVLDKFWREIFDLLDRTFEFQIVRGPLLAILGTFVIRIYTIEKIT